MLLSIYVLIAVLILFGTSIIRTKVNEEYISKNQSNCVKGVFIIMVFARHIWPYINDAGVEFTGMDDRIFHLIDGTLGQLIVAMFLFYSGYGVMESYRKKGIEYVNGMPKRRILNTLLNFDIAVCVYLLVDFFLNISYPLSHVLLSFTGWLSVGNSNWYIFVILLCYIATFFGLKISEEFKFKKCRGGVILACISICYILLAMTKQSYWYDTIFCFPLGVFFSIKRHAINEMIYKRYIICLLSTSLLFFALVLFPFSHSKYLISGNILAIVFTCMIVILTMKIKIESRILNWLGTNLFPLYIYQRISMIVLAKGFDGFVVKEYTFLYIVSCAVLTVLFSKLYKFIQISIK